MPIRMLLTVTLSLGVALTGAAARAHCGEDCFAPFEAELGPMSTRIAADGVLAFSVAYGRADTALEFFTVTVRDAMGATLDGELEVNADFSLIVWRPAMPWVAGDHTVVTRLDTAAWSTAINGAPAGACLTNDRTFEFVVEPDPLPAPAAPKLLAEQSYARWPDDSLAALVCCDGAMPSLTSNPGYCPSYRITHDDGACAPMQELGVLAVSYTATLPAAVAGNAVTRLIDADGIVRHGTSMRLFAPQCLQLETLDLARGVVFTEERCHGDDLADSLGTVPIDPSPGLTSCTGPTYVCEIDKFDRWDETRCVTWPDGAPFEVPEPASMEDDTAASEAAAEDGCGCTTRRAPAALLALTLPLLALRRRRR